MHRVGSPWRVLVVCALGVLGGLGTGCGGTFAPTQAPSVRTVLTSGPEALQLESATTRRQLYREIALTSEAEQGRSAKELVLFPVLVDGSAVAAPGFSPRTDLLQAPTSTEGLVLELDAGGESWPTARQSNLQGLSEKEAAELVARSLIADWGLHPAAPVQVERATGAPYAAAYVDGILRINPSFLYLAAAGTP